LQLLFFLWERYFKNDMKKFTSNLLTFAAIVLITGVSVSANAQSFGTRETITQAMQGVRPAQATKAFDMAYVDVNLLKKVGLASEEPDEDMIDWKVPELAQWLQARFAKVLAANGLEGEGQTVAMPLSNGQAVFAEAIASQQSKRPILVITPVKYSKSRPTLFSKAGAIYFELQWIDPVEGRPSYFGEVQVIGGLGFDPVLGILKTNRVNAAWADAMVVASLNILAKKGFVELSQGKAIKPVE
jgi:predicted alpha/beta hydrolase family esterase